MDQTKLIQAVDKVPDLKGAGIAYIGDRQCTLIRKPAHNSGFATYVVFEERESFVPPGPSSPFVPKPAGAPLPVKPPRPPSNIGAELKKMGWDCGGVVVSATSAGGSIAAEPFTAGFSTVPLVIASTALVATSLRCGMDVGRLLNAGFAPDSNRALDNSEWYSTASTIIEVIDVTDAVRGGLSTIGKYKALRKASNKSMIELLKGAPAAERKRIAEEMAIYTGEATSRRSFLRLVRQGKLAKLYTVKQIRVEVAKELLGSALGSKTLWDSSQPAGKDSKAGVISELTVHIMQEK